MTQTRTWQDSPEVPLPIPRLGPGTLVLTSARTVYFNAQSNGLSNPDVGLIVRGVRYMVSAHLERGADGAWDLQGATDYDKRRHLYVSRGDRLVGDRVSDAATATLRAAIVQAVRDFAGANPTRFTQAEAVHLNNAVLRLEEKQAEIERQRQEVGQEINALRLREEALA